MTDSNDPDESMPIPEGLSRLVALGLVNLEPWEVMTKEAALERLRGLRRRYSRKYVPFARRGDNDDVACLDPERPGEVVVIHDFAEEGWERPRYYATFWAGSAPRSRT